MLSVHPDWLAVDDTGTASDPEYLWVSPANVDVRAHVVAVARDILTHYAVDGLHLDRIRTPGAVFSHDAPAMAALGQAQLADPALTFDAFMTQSVTAMVRELDDVLLDVRPDALLTAAVFGIHTVLPGCNTSAGLADAHQDSWAWAADGIVDALCPMAYWDIDPGSCTDWATLLDVFLEHSPNRPLWMGMYATDGTFQIDKLSARIALSRARGAAGTVLYSSGLLDETGGWDALRGTPNAPGPYLLDAPVPDLTWR